MTLKNFVFKKLIIFLTATIVASYSLLPFFNVGTANAAPVNLIANPLVETSVSNSPTDWQTGGWGTNSTSFSYLSTGSTGDNNSLNVSISSYTSGDAKWYFSPVNVTADEKYTYSDSYESTTTSEVIVAFNLTGGSTTYQEIGAPIASPNWTQFSANFVTPSNIISTTVYHLINSVGSLSTDNFSLTSTSQPSISISSPLNNASVSGNSVMLSANASDSNGISNVVFQLDGVNIGSPITASPYNYNWNSETVANGVHSITAVVTNIDGISTASNTVNINVNNVVPLGTNIIPNPLLETPNPTNTSLPLNWQTGGWGTNSTSFSYLKTGSTGDNNSLNVKTTAYTSGDAKWYFSPVNVTAGQVYIFSDYYESTISSQIDVAYTLSSGQTDYIVLGSLAASSTWQKFSTNFTVPSGVVSATIYHLIAGVGSLTTDDFSLATSTQLSASITSPTASTASSPALTGNVTLSAEATYNNGVRSVQFQIDGVNTGTAVSVAPYNYVWNSASTTNGTHKITALVTGDDNQTVTTSPVSVEVSNTDPLGGNLIPNPLMETANPSDASQPQDWSVETWGTNTFTSSYGSTGCSTGDSGCVTINMTKYTSGDAKWAFTPQVVTQDTQYVYSEKYKSTVQTQVDAVFAMSDGSTVYEILGLPYVSTGGTVFTSKFSVPYGAKTISIYHLIEAVGSLTFDDASITPYTPTGFSRPIVTLTFDDGYQTEYTNALPLLKQYGFTSTQFIITDEIGKTGFMTAAELKAFTADGDEMASHTVTHDDLTQETTSALNNEMTQSQATLKTDTGVAPTDFAYPYGLYNANVVTAAKTVYKAARGVESGLNSKDNYDQYDLKVENVYTVTPTADITDWVAQAKATNTWLILVYHGVDTNVNDPVDGDIYDVPPAQLSAQLGSIKASGVTVETMSQAIAEVTPQL